MADASLAVHPVDEKLPTPRLAALGLQHVLVMYAGAVAVPLIIGRALKLSPEQVAMLISADLFCCGLVTLIQSLGMGRHFGIRLPVMMGVTLPPWARWWPWPTPHRGPTARAPSSAPSSARGWCPLRWRRS
jgi:xanthine/uracil permease